MHGNGQNSNVEFEFSSICRIIHCALNVDGHSNVNHDGSPRQVSVCENDPIPTCSIGTGTPDPICRVYACAPEMCYALLQIKHTVNIYTNDNHNKINT